MKTTAKILSLLAILLFSLLFGCNRDPKVITETTTRGTIRIAADESFKLLVDAENYTFHALYKYANITPIYKPEAEVVEDFINDSIRTIIISRKLTPEEEKYLLSLQSIARTTKVAYDGVTFISHPDNKDLQLRYDQLEAIFKGDISNWNQLDPKFPKQELIVVFDHSKSGNFRYIKENFIGENPVPASCFAVENNQEVLNYVKDKKNALGIIGVNWISDKDDSLSNKFLSEISIIGIGAKGDDTGEGIFRKPYQGYLAEGSYPLIREVYIISRESFAGLGSGFASFIAGETGQRIILKAGLAPATVPIRLMQVKNTF
jgi:phosphate transport system substrate-binding protein